MAAVLQHRRMGTTARLALTPANGEFIWDTDTFVLYMGDGTTAGGVQIGGSAAIADVFAVGNTTAASSSSTVSVTRYSISGAGGISVGLSGAGNIVISGPTTSASGSVSDGFALGNTTGATSSTTGTLTNISFSGAGGASVGFSTTAAGAGVLIISGATQTAPTVSLFAVGNTTSSTSSGVIAAGSLSFDGAGAVSVGVSNSSVVISAPAQSAAALNIYAVGNTTTSTTSGAIAAGSLSFDGAGVVSVGISGSSVVISAPAGAASGTSESIFALGNTTAATSSTTATLTNYSLSGAGGISLGFSTTAAGAGVIVVSGPVAQTVQTIGGYATGNTTGSSSSTTFDARSVTISGAGAASVGYSSNNILIISVPTAAASGTSENVFALGNTTAATSSTTLTLTNYSLSGAGGVSIGMSTTAAGAGVIIISGATGAGASATSKGITFTGNTTGDSSSTTNAITGETVSGAGGVTVGVSGGTLLISGATVAAQITISNLVPTPVANTTSLDTRIATNGIASCFSMLAPVNVTLNQMVFFATAGFPTAPRLTISTTAAASATGSGTLAYAESITLAIYSQSATGAAFGTSATTSIVSGFTQTYSWSQTGSSVTWSLTDSVANPSGTSTQVTATFSSSSAQNATNFGTWANGLTASYQGLVRYPVPWATSFSPGVYVIGMMRSSGTSTGGLAGTGTLGAPTWSASLYAFDGGPNMNNFRSVVGGTAQSFQYGFGWGITSSTTAAGSSVMPTSLVATSLGMGSGQTANYAPYCEMGVF
jgi:hypothetical protein